MQYFKKRFEVVEHLLSITIKNKKQVEAIISSGRNFSENLGTSRLRAFGINPDLVNHILGNQQKLALAKIFLNIRRTYK